MIFKKGYRRFIASKQVKSGGLTLFKSILWAVLSGILTLSAYFGILLITRENSESVPVFFYTTYFGLLYLYTIIDILVIFIILLANIQFICFPEIVTNRWNLMTSMGIPISGLVGSKVTASVLALIRQYFIGFLIILGCGFLFKLPFSVNYLIALFFIGSISLILLSMISMAMMVFSRKISTARNFLFLALLAVLLLFVFFEFFHADMFQVDILVSMFSLEFPSFITVSAGLFVTCYAVILFVARSRSMHQELMPLGVFDIKPLVTGSETELFMTDGMKYTTILDTEILNEEHSERVIVEKPDIITEDEPIGTPYVLFIIMCSVILAVFAAMMMISVFAPSYASILTRFLGEGLSFGLMTEGGKIVLGVLVAASAALLVILFVLKKRNTASDKTAPHNIS